MPLTGEEVVTSVCRIVRASFNTVDIAAVYKEKPLQTVKCPFAVVQQIKASSKPELRNRAEQSYIIDVRVHPEITRTNTNSWLRSIGSKLEEALETLIIVGQNVRASSQEMHIEDSVLHVISNYSFKVVKILAPAVPMNTLTVEGIKSQPTNLIVAGEYATATLMDKDTHTMQIGDAVIDGGMVDMSILTRDTAMWSCVQNGDSLVTRF